MRTKRITPLLFFLPFLALLGVLGSCLTPVPDGAPSAALHRAPRAGPVEGPRDWANLEEMHAYHVERFVESEGFGVSRIMPPEWLRGITVDDTTFTVVDLELITLMATAGEPPFVHAGHPGRVLRGEAVPMRPLKPIESDAIGHMRRGAKVALVAEPDGTPRVVGALRARKECVDCHASEGVVEGELMGAFSYRLKRRASPPTDGRL